MQLEIYVDILFLINLVMNLIIILLVRRFRRLHTSICKVLLSAAFGAVAACFIALFLRGHVILAFLIEYLFLANLMIYIAFGFRDLIEYVIDYFCFLFMTFFLGGILQSVFLTLGANYYLKSFYERIMHSKITLVLIIILSTLLTPLVAYLCILYQKRKRKADFFYEVFMDTGEKNYTCKGLMDTGNSLYEPMHNSPVVIIDSSYFEKEYRRLLMNNPALYCVIPYNSVGKECGILHGFRLKQIVIHNSEGEYCTNNIVVALSSHGFSKRQGYEVLLHQDLQEVKVK